MFATIVTLPWNTAIKVQGSFFNDRDKAIDYAQRHLGVEAVEEIGCGIIWRREDCDGCTQNSD